MECALHFDLIDEVFVWSSKDPYRGKDYTKGYEKCSRNALNNIKFHSYYQLPYEWEIERRKEMVIIILVFGREMKETQKYIIEKKLLSILEDCETYNKK